MVDMTEWTLRHAFRPVWSESAGGVLISESDQCVMCNRPRSDSIHTNRRAP